MSSDQSPLKIILVDDNADDQFFIKSALSKFREVKFESFYYPEKFLDYLHTLTTENLPDIVIIDINMPRMTGFEVIETIGKLDLHHKIKFFILSSAITEKDKGKCDALKLQCFIKPPSIEEFKNVIEQMVEHWKAEKI